MDTRITKEELQEAIDKGWLKPKKLSLILRLRCYLWLAYLAIRPTSKNMENFTHFLEINCFTQHFPE